MNKSYRTTLIGHEKNSKKGTPCFILLMILTWFISQFFTISGITGIQSQTSFQKDYIISNIGEFLAMRIDIPSSHPPNQTQVSIV